MALKDLIGTKSAQAEEAIEGIVRGLITYDEVAREVVLTPEGMRLANRAKVLVYLTALLGWPFVTDADVATDAKPAEIEAATGVAGGSLRPLLKEMLEGRLLSATESRYAVRSTSLAAVASELASPVASAPRKRTTSRRKATKTAEA